VREQHGVWSLILIFLSIAVGTISIVLSSLVFALLYIIICLASFMIIVYSFCAKCPCRHHECGHILPGKLAKLMPKRAEGPYTLRDYSGVLIPFLFVIGVPQIWLAGRVQLMVMFWLLIIFALVEIVLKVCKGCGNKYCPINNRLN